MSGAGDGSAARGRLYVIDVDGTLLDSRHRVTPAVRAAVGAARAAGAQVMLASSRAPGAMVAVLDALDAPPEEVFVASQGALTLRAGDARRATRDGEALCALHRHPMPLGPARELAGAALELGLAVSWFTGVDWFVSHVDELVHREAAVVALTPRVVGFPPGPSAPPDKLMFMSQEPEELGTLLARLPAGLVAQTSNPTYLEVTAAGVDKAAAVRRHCASTGLDAASVTAIGDGPNDLSLLAWAGTSIAPANARPEVLAVVDHVVASNDEDGVAEALHLAP